MQLDETMSLMNLDYEVKVLKDPQNKYLWLEYSTSLPSYEAKALVLQRAIDLLQPEDTQLLWTTYLDMALEEIKDLNYYDHRIQFGVVNRLFQRALVHFNDVEVWYKYLKFLNGQADVKFILNEYVNCLRSVDFEFHSVVWPLFLQFADIVGQFDPKLASSILLRFISHGQYDINHLTKLVSWRQKDAIEKVVEILKIDDYGLDDWKLVLEFLKQEDVVRIFIRKFPEDYSYGHIKLAESAQTNDKKKEIYSFALARCTTVADFTAIYESYLSFLEDSMGDDPSDYELNQYEMLLSSRQRMINDIYLKGDPQNIDNWFKRIEMYEHPDTESALLKTYVEAIKTLNPLTYYSNSGQKLADIWIKYAGHYYNSGDAKTADFIYSKAVLSKFKSSKELESIYKGWCDIYSLEVKSERPISILEGILFKDEEISRSLALWDLYFEKVRNTAGTEKYVLALQKKLLLKYATAFDFISLAHTLQEEKRFGEAFKTYELGLKEFNDEKIRFEIFNKYLVEMIKYTDDKEKVRDLFDRALVELPKDLVKPIIILYSEFEFQNGLILKSFNIVNDFIFSTSLDPIELILLLANKYSGQVDLRQNFEKWMTLLLTTESLVKLVKQFIAFETSNKQYDRVRALFKYLHTNSSYPFKDWEDFELEHGDESTFKQMLRVKNQLKDSVSDPSGFVKATASTSRPTNPDSIDIEM